MAEEAEDLAAPEAANTLAGGEAADPVAVALALGGASREQADGFLRDQRRLTALQISRLKAQDAHFHEEAELELAHLRWRRFEDRMKGATRLMLVAVGALLLGAVALAMWQASRAEGLVVDAFSVPPAFAAGGVTADVLAGRSDHPFRGHSRFRQGAFTRTFQGSQPGPQPGYQGRNPGNRHLPHPGLALPETVAGQ